MNCANKKFLKHYARISTSRQFSPLVLSILATSVRERGDIHSALSIAGISRIFPPKRVHDQLIGKHSEGQPQMKVIASGHKW